MVVGAMKARRVTAKESTARALESTTRAMSTARTTSIAKAMRKAKTRGRKAKAKDKEWTRDQHPTRASKATAGHVASGGIRRVNVGKVTFKEWRKFRVLPRVQWRRVQRPHLQLRRRQRLSKRSMMRMSHAGFSAWSTDEWHQSQQTEMTRGTSWCWTVGRCQRLVHMHGAQT